MITKEELWTIRERLLDKISKLPPEIQTEFERELNKVITKLMEKKQEQTK